MPSLVVPPGAKTPRLAPLEAEIERYGLADHIAELDEQGLCIVPFAKLQVGSDFVERAREALLRVARGRLGGRFEGIDAPARDVNANAENKGQFILSHLLHEGDLFEEIYVNPIRKTVMRHLLGDVHRMSTSNGWVKVKTPAAHDGPLTTPLHADTVAPTPWPVSEPHVANMNWILTDYTREDGAFAYVPGSHRRGAQPGPEAVEEAVAVRAPAGSLFFFHGATWHGSFRKETDGLRLSIHGLCCRPYYLPQQDYHGSVSPEIFERNADPEYLKMLVGEDDPWLRKTPHVL
jgi:ectoine hydroxylase-related dioxygenase (phytanoyl-CoA dioxygenase family)